MSVFFVKTAIPYTDLERTLIDIAQDLRIQEVF
jgi:hypothetical protein